MPISLLEAMSLGKPIVASAVGSIPSMVESDMEAILVEPGNEQELARALERVLEDRALQALLTTSARKRFLREYTAARMAVRYLRFYERALSGEGHTRLFEAN